VLGRSFLRCSGQLAGDIAFVLGHTAKTVGVAADLVDMHIALAVQRSDQLVHFRESRGDESGFFLARIGPVGDPDVQPESSKLVLGERGAGDKPVCRIDFLDGDCGYRRILVKDFARKFAESLNGPAQ
jgi:hypothetical protein